MKKLLLIEPAPKVEYRIRGVHYFERLSNRDYFRKSSLALGVLAGLTPPDWEIKILQEPTDEIDFGIKVDLVGITTVTHTVKRGYEIADEFRKRGVMVIMGGIHATVLFNEALNHCDSVCIGEA
ncbi:MAG: B12-binding domain-containing radical SAM protein, partial [Bacteroidetes bacterium]|nr:B12-binding domain-containing radical SAM protein [Bacteroidota bacterium]